MPASRWGPRTIGFASVLVAVGALGGGRPARSAFPAPMLAPSPGRLSGGASRIAPFRGPVHFTENRGQVDGAVRYYARMNDATVWLTPGAVVFDARHRTRSGAVERRDVSSMRFLGAHAAPRLAALEPTNHRVHHLVGADPGRWRADIPTALRVRYEGLYPGIDLEIHGVDGRVEYDWLIAPGARLGDVRFMVDGGGGSRLDDQGNLVIEFADGSLAHLAPIAWEDAPGGRTPARVRFEGRGQGVYGFHCDGCDPSTRLVVDPVLDFSSYLGGEGIEAVEDIAVAGDGSAVVVGTTRSIDFPLAHPLPGAASGGSSDVFVTKFAAGGETVEFSTFLGGDAGDDGHGVAVDASGHVYVTGRTESEDFPLKGAFQGWGQSGWEAAFLAKLAPDGSSLVYSTLLGGQGYLNLGNDVAVDSSGSAVVVGLTNADTFPLKLAVQTKNGAQHPSGFVTKFTPAGNALVFSTYLGGGRWDEAKAVAIDGSGAAYVVGFTTSADFPVKNPVQSRPGGSIDGFLTKFAPTGSMISSTFLGGIGPDIPRGVAVDPGGSAAVVGETWSRNFPLKGAMQAKLGGMMDLFVTRIGGDGKSLVFSTFLGGSYWEIAGDVGLASNGDVWVAGETWSADFPRLGPPGASRQLGDAFVTRLAANGSAIVSSDLFGGESRDLPAALGLDASGGVWVAGATDSGAFPVVHPIQGAPAGARDAFVTRWVPSLASRVEGARAAPLAPGAAEPPAAVEEAPLISSEEYFTVEAFPLPTALRQYVALVAPIDFDDDGDLDVILGDEVIPPEPGLFGRGALVALRNDGAGHFADATGAVLGDATSEGPLTLLVADFDRDGRQDLFVPNWGQDREPGVGAQDQLFLQKKAGRLTEVTKTAVPPALDHTAIAASGDFDGDGDLDVYCPPAGPEIFFPPHFLINNGKAKFTTRKDNLPPDMVISWWGRRNDGAAAIDFDRDGDPDLALASYGRPVDLLVNNGKGVFAHANKGATPPHPWGKNGGSEMLVAGDFDQDGWPDLMVLAVQLGVGNHRYQLLLNNRNGTFRDATTRLVGSRVGNGWLRAAVDINGDGLTDYLDNEEATGPLVFVNRGDARLEESAAKMLPSIEGHHLNASFPFDVDADGDVDIFGVEWPYHDGEGILHPGTGFVLRNVKPFPRPAQGVNQAK